jgi:hypothetical protein
MRIPAIVMLSTLALLAAPGCSVQSGHQPHYYVTPVEMLEVYGTYPLTNGDVLRISRDQRRYWAEMHSTGRMEIVPVDSIVFQEKDGNLRFTFKPLPFTTAVRVDGLGGPETQMASVFGPSGVEGEFGK